MNLQAVESSYVASDISTDYTETHPPEPLPLPDEIEPDMEPLQMSDGSTIDALSPGELCLQKHIRPGFIHDFVMGLRGTESTTLLSIWGALFAISGVLQRRAWIDWVIERLYPNLFLIFIARPGICKKTVSITFSDRVIRKMEDLFDLQEDKEIFAIPSWRGGTTPEYLFELLKPREVLLNADAMSFERMHPLGSRLAIVADELSEFLGKQKYNQGMVSRLTKLYDCPDFAQIGTKKNKTEEVRNVFVNFCGGTTPSSFRDIIPSEAHGGGLMSRCIIVLQEHPTRRFHRPRRIKGLPDINELARRLAWIAENRMGQYDLDDEAEEIYKTWYDEHKDDLDRISDSDTRADILLMKTAHLISASGYERSPWITADDLKASMFLIDIAAQHKKRVESEIMSDSTWSQNIQIVSSKIKGWGSTTRERLLRAVSYRMNTDELNKVLVALSQSNSIYITLDDRPRFAPGHDSHEAYTWKYEEA